jgi:hypothetical protein
MLTLDATVNIPESVLSTLLEQDAVLLNIRSNHYFALDEVGRRLWGLLSEGNNLRDIYQTLLHEYEVDPGQLEQDMLELLNHLRENGLVEIVQV